LTACVLASAAASATTLSSTFSLLSS